MSSCKRKVISNTILYSKDGESKHTIYDANLADGAKLHQFKDKNGELWSAIYNRYYEEQLRCRRELEYDMIEEWNATYRASRAMYSMEGGA